ncbi:MAG: pyridoxamine 5'-phosphate oxidase family protein [Planctomycetota bacterium]|nr:pyridoxamine 5'-phosphate oxidase family protein [Planctomycetota bacterium]
MNDALSDIRTVLAQRRFGVLAIHDAGQPHAGLVAFAVSDDLRRIVFCSPRSTRKVANLAADPRSALLVHTAANDEADLASALALTAVGTASPAEPLQQAACRALLLARHPSLADFAAKPDTLVMVLHVKRYDLVRNFQDVHSVEMP